MSSREVPDPFNTLARSLWIGGGQWAGKTTVSSILAARHTLTAYHYDFHDARGHNDRRVADRARHGESLDGPDLDSEWVTTTPEQMTERTLAGFPQRFRWSLEDLASLDSPRPVLAEGWGLRPELVTEITNDPARMVVLVATEEFRAHQQHQLSRAAGLTMPVSDPIRAQNNRLERDRLLAQHAADRARDLGIAVIEVDGTSDAETIADIVEAHFSRFL